MFANGKPLTMAGDLDAIDHRCAILQRQACQPRRVVNSRRFACRAGWQFILALQTTAQQYRRAELDWRRSAKPAWAGLSTGSGRC